MNYFDIPLAPGHFRRIYPDDPEWQQWVGRSPSLLQRIGNLGTAVVQHALSGFSYVDETTRRTRLQLCESCPTYWDGEHRRCNHPSCGCNMDVKAGWATQACPIGRWAAIGPTETSTAPTVRHLAYHIAPFTGPIWRHNVRQLRRRLELFDGRRVVAIVTGPGLEAPEVVQAALGSDVEYLILPNDQRLREVVTLTPLLERTLCYAGVADATFYAHAKGVTRPVNPGVTVHYWTDAMYVACLDYWPVVAEMLQHRPTVGAFKKIGAGFEGSTSTWHWSGAFFWLRNAAAAKRDWRRIDQQWWGSESWIGLHFSPDEAAALLLTDVVGVLDLYRMDYLRLVAMPALVRFQREHASRRTGSEG